MWRNPGRGFLFEKFHNGNISLDHFAPNTNRDTKCEAELSREVTI